MTTELTFGLDPTTDIVECTCGFIGKFREHCGES
jgi:hypothetical protein